MAIKSVCETCGMTLNEKASFCPTCGGRMNMIEELDGPMSDATETRNAENINKASEASAESQFTPGNNPALDAAMNNGNSSPNTSSIPNMGGNIPPVPPVNIPPVGSNNSIPPVTPNMYGYQPQNQTPKSGKDTMALIGMILGIIALALCCLNLLDLPVAIAGLILSILGIKSKKRGGMAIAGIICSSIAFILCLIIFFVGLSEVKYKSSYYNNIFNEIIEEELEDEFEDYVYNYNWD